MLVTRLTMVHSLCAHSYVGGLLPETAVRCGPDGEGPGDHRLGQLWVSNGNRKVTLGDLPQPVVSTGCLSVWTVRPKQRL